MPRPKTAAKYVKRIARLAEEGYKPPSIHRQLQEEADEQGWADCPSERTVRRLYEEVGKWPGHVRRESARFKWPQTIEELGVLPWSAARSALDLVRFRDERAEEPPTIREAKWFAQLRLAAPGVPNDIAASYAAALAENELASAAGLENPCQLPGLDLYLAYQPWRSEEDRRACNEAADRRGLPHWVGKPPLAVGVRGDPNDLDALRELSKRFFNEDIDVDLMRQNMERGQALLEQQESAGEQSGQLAQRGRTPFNEEDSINAEDTR